MVVPLDVKEQVHEILKLVSRNDFNIRNEATLINLATKLMILTEQIFKDQSGRWKKTLVIATLKHILIQEYTGSTEVRDLLLRFIDASLPPIIDTIVNAAKSVNFGKAKSAFKKFFTCCCK